MGSVLAAIGTVAAVLSGPLSVYVFTIPDLKCFWEDTVWIVYVVLANGFAAFLLVWWHFANAAVKNEDAPPGRRTKNFLPVAYALSSTLIGTQSVVQAKCMSITG